VCFVTDNHASPPFSSFLILRSESLTPFPSWGWVCLVPSARQVKVEGFSPKSDGKRTLSPFLLESSFQSSLLRLAVTENKPGPFFRDPAAAAKNFPFFSQERKVCFLSAGVGSPLLQALTHRPIPFSLAIV